MHANVLAIVNQLNAVNTTDVVELSSFEFIAYMVIGIPSWFLYVLVIFLLIRPSNQTLFGNSYYRLVSVIGISVSPLRLIF